LEEEVARMTSLNNFLTTVGGFQEWVFEDMVDETIGLLKELAALIPNSVEAAQELLMQRFNNPEISNAIIYHLRLLASSWLKGNPAPYQDFIQGDLGIDGYCKEWLEAPNQEIDHLGIMLLIDVLLKPVGFAVEIIYLDRSAGSQVNSHMFQDEEDGVPTNPGSPIIHLLYRPSHYDILYKDNNAAFLLQQQVGEVVVNPNIQVNRATSFSHHHDVRSTPSSLHGFSDLDMTALLSIPGFCAPPPSHHGFPAQYSPVESTFPGSPISAVSPASSGPSPGNTSSVSLATQFPPQQPTQILASPILSAFPSPETQLPIHNHTSQSNPIGPPLSSHAPLPSHPPLPSELSPPNSASSFRPSKYEWEAAADWQEGPVVFKTSTFKNSHYNTAHYNNPNFQPEEWSPDCEESENGSKSRKRST
jgi:ubiquitin thioesterase protein OTUB1